MAKQNGVYNSNGTIFSSGGETKANHKQLNRRSLLTFNRVAMFLLIIITISVIYCAYTINNMNNKLDVVFQKQDKGLDCDGNLNTYRSSITGESIDMSCNVDQY